MIGLAAAHRQVISAASDLAGPNGIVVWCEAEKHDIVRFVQDLARPIEQGIADLVLPARTAISWNSYPLAQQYMEQFGALFHSELTGGRVVEYHMGPMAMDQKAVGYVLGFVDNYPPNRGSNWNAILLPRIAAARTKALQIVNVPVDFILDPRMREEETGDIEINLKRHYQMDLVETAALVAERFPLVE